jgi:hypothetical protein
MPKTLLLCQHVDSVVAHGRLNIAPHHGKCRVTTLCCASNLPPILFFISEPLGFFPLDIAQISVTKLYCLYIL